MGTPRVHRSYDVHCLDCGASETSRTEPTRCVKRRCKSTNIVWEDNEKYCLTALFTKQVEGEAQYYEPDEARGMDYHTLHLPNNWSL